MMFVGCVLDNDGDVYRMYDTMTKRLATTRDNIWLRRMYYTEPQDIELTKEPTIVMEIYKPIEKKVEEGTPRL